jgi:hypothetical protein
VGIFFTNPSFLSSSEAGLDQAFIYVISGGLALMRFLFLPEVQSCLHPTLFILQPLAH